MEYIKERWIPISIAWAQWFITTILQVDRLFFVYDYETKYYVVIKILYLFFLLAVWCFIFEAAKRMRAGDENWRRGFFIFRVYLFLMTLFLLIIWPGTWGWDDIQTIGRISHYDQWNVWQHIISGIYQDVLLQILPFPGGIILLQNIIISVCVAFIVTKLEVIFGIGMIKNRIVDTVVKLLPFLLPPVLCYQFSGYRMGMYVYIELVMLVILAGMQYDRKEWDIKYLIMFSFLCVVSATWRTESLFYVPCAVLLVALADKRILSKKKKIGCIFFLVIGTWAMGRWQGSELGNADYQVISFLRPCVELVRTADYLEDADALDDIDRIVKLEVIRNNPTLNGERLFWDTDAVRDGYTDADYSAFLRALVKLSMKYPKTVAAERWNLFISGSGINGSSFTFFELSANLFESEESYPQWFQNAGWAANKPVFRTARKTLINALEMRITKSDGSYTYGIKRLVWNAVIPELILLYAWLKLFILKKWRWFSICTAVVLRIPVVVLTQPSNWFMYVLSFYFLGYVLLTYGILAFWSMSKNNANW